jgi:hypothetical protein
MEEQKEVNISEKELEREPLTLEEMLLATQGRVQEISREFTQGFKFLSNFPKTVTYFGSTSFKEEDEYYKKARALSARIVKELGYAVITGGGPGIMEAANRGAKEAGGESIGLTIRLPKEQVMNPYLSRHVDFYYFFSRKVCLTYSAETFLFFPGGFGTMDEFFEIITLKQTHKIQNIPVIAVGKEYWDKIVATMKEDFIPRGTIREKDLDLFKITDDDDEIIKIIKEAPVHTSIPYRGFKANLI